MSAVALPNGATSGESGMPISKGEGGATAGKRRIRGVANGYGVVRGRVSGVLGTPDRKDVTFVSSGLIFMTSGLWIWCQIHQL